MKNIKKGDAHPTVQSLQIIKIIKSKSEYIKFITSAVMPNV